MPLVGGIKLIVGLALLRWGGGNPGGTVRNKDSSNVVLKRYKPNTTISSMLLANNMETKLTRAVAYDVGK